MKRRLHKLLKTACILLIVGLAYGVFCLQTGVYVPCLFHRATGLLCPGCGVTGLCLSVMQLDFLTAYHCNPALFMALPVIGILILRLAYTYVTTGRSTTHGWQTYLAWGLVVYFLVWGVIRNVL